MKRVLTLMLFILFLLMGYKMGQVEFEHGRLIYDERIQADKQMNRIVVAFSEDEFSGIWNRFRFEKEHPSVDFEESGVIFAQTLENSCPKEIETLAFDKEGKNLVIDTKQKGTTCNDVGIPRTFVFEVDKEKLENVYIIRFEGEEFVQQHQTSPNQ